MLAARIGRFQGGIDEACTEDALFLELPVSVSRFLDRSEDGWDVSWTHRHKGSGHIGDGEYGEEFHRGRILLHGPAHHQSQFAVLLRGLCKFAYMHIVRDQSLRVRGVEKARDLSGVRTKV
jgi:hypothetical protein